MSSGLRRHAVSWMNSEWCYWLLIEWTKSWKVLSWTEFSQQLKYTKAQRYTVSIYNSPPQMSINMFFLSCIFLYVFFLTYFIFVHNLFFSCFQRREQCWTEVCVMILYPESAEIKSVEYVCKCDYCTNNTTAILLYFFHHCPSPDDLGNSGYPFIQRPEDWAIITYISLFCGSYYCCLCSCFKLCHSLSRVDITDLCKKPSIFLFQFFVAVQHSEQKRKMTFTFCYRNKKKITVRP